MINILRVLAAVLVLLICSTVYWRLWWYISGGIIKVVRYLKKQFSISDLSE